MSSHPYHGTAPCIGGPLHGESANVDGRGPLLAMISPVRSVWARATSDETILTTEYRLEEVGAAWGVLRLSGWAWIWQHAPMGPNTILMSLLGHVAAREPGEKGVG